MKFSKLLSLSLLIISANLNAKGLDTLKPSEDELSKEEAQPTSTPATPPAANGAPAATATPSAQAIPSSTTNVVAEKKIELSETSKKLANKLYLASGFGFLRILKSKIGEWSSNGLADVSIGWKFMGAPDKKLSILGNLRYTPIEVNSKIDGQSYRGVIDGYHLGVVGGYKLGEGFDLIASVELGYLLVYLSSVDNFALQEDTENNEVVSTLGFGGDWHVHEKIRIGPRIYAGFGAFQTMQISAAGTFIF